MPNGSGRVPILATAREAWLFLRDNWRLLLPAAGVTALISQIGFAIAVLSGSAAGGGSALNSQVGTLAMALPALLAGLMFTAAVLRKYLRNEFTGRIGLAFGADELRLLGVVAAFACMIIPLVTLVFLIVSVTILPRLAATQEELLVLMQDPEALNAALVAALGPGGTSMFLLLSFLAMGLAVYLYARLFMVNAATMGERRIVMFQTWPWSRGNVLRLLGAIVLTWLPAYLVDSLVLEFGFALLNPLRESPSAGILLLLFNAVATFVALLVGVPSVVLGGIFYKGLRPTDFVAK